MMFVYWMCVFTLMMINRTKLPPFFVDTAHISIREMLYTAIRGKINYYLSK